MRMPLTLAAFAAAAMLPVTPAAAVLAVGAKAPAFATRGARGGEVVAVDLAAALRRGPVVLYFFPAAFTGGCNAEARAFAARIDAFRAAGAEVIGLSADPVETLKPFSASECAGRFTVASAGPAVIRGYDVAMAHDGRRMTRRTSYVIARDGRVAFVHDDMNPARHVSLTLEAVERLSARR